MSGGIRDADSKRADWPAIYLEFSRKHPDISMHSMVLLVSDLEHQVERLNGLLTANSVIVDGQLAKVRDLEQANRVARDLLAQSETDRDRLTRELSVAKDVASWDRASMHSAQANAEREKNRADTLHLEVDRLTRELGEARDGLTAAYMAGVEASKDAARQAGERKGGADGR